MAFASPSEFLSSLQARYRDISWHEVDEDLLKKMTEHRKKLGRPAPNVKPNHYDPVVRDYWSGLQAIFPLSDRKYLAKYVAVGSLDAVSLNAACLKSPEGFIAIVLNAGLMTYLNKLTKLMIAAEHPEAVTFCNRESPRPLTSQVLKAWMYETTEHYSQTKRPLGPVLDLAPDRRVEAMRRLWVWELFVLCHEIGHLIAGHLERKELWSPDPSFGMVEAFQEDRSLELEIQADVLGFVVLREYLYRGRAARSGNRDDRWMVAELVLLFNLWAMLGMSESATHPHPIDRIHSIVANVHGVASARKLEASYDQDSPLDDFMSTPLIANEKFCRGLLRTQT